MKIAIFFEAGNFSGGVFHQSLSTLKSILKKELSEISVDIITSIPADVLVLKKNSVSFKIFNRHKYAARFYKCENFFLFRYITKKFKIQNPFEKFIKKEGYDLIFFLSPSKYINYCGDINFIVNLFDFNHRILNIFPEYRSYDVIEETDQIIKKSISRAFKIFVNTSKAKRDLLEIYGCPEKKVDILTYHSNLISVYKENYNNLINKEEFLDKYNISKNEILFFYPAQFWTHKNHKYLIDVAEILLKKNISFKFIFCGSKKSNYFYIKKQISIKNLESKILMLDYVSDHEIISFYRFCSAVVVPTYVGRSSLPLIESFYFQKPLFYGSGILDEKLEEMVNLFDLNNPLDLVDKINQFIYFKNSSFEKKVLLAKNYYNTYFTNDLRTKKIHETIKKYHYLKKRWKN